MPVLRDGDCFLLLLVAVYLKPFCLSILNDHLAVIRSDSVKHVKEKLSIDLSPLGQLRRQEGHQLLVLRVMLKEVLNVDLGPLGNINPFDISQGY